MLASAHPSEGLAQSWRRTTPRDTVKIYANSHKFEPARLQLGGGLDLFVRFRGTFGMFPGKNSEGFDAQFTYLAIPGWAAPYPLMNPPTFNGRRENIYLEYADRTAGLGGDTVRTIEKTYNPLHVYTAKFPSGGLPFEFRIKAGNGQPNSYYSNGTGYIQAELAQFTAGISMRSKVIDFGNTNIGSSTLRLDSIASYGIDPLRIDSVKIVGSNEFTFVSQRGNAFSLPNEGTNEFKVFYSPSSRGDVFAYLYIYCANTDGPNKIKAVQLKGHGVAPTLAIGPKTLDFGKIRVGQSSLLHANVYNGGNGTLNLTYTGISGATEFTISRNIAGGKVDPGSLGQIQVRFAPTAEGKFRAVLQIRAVNVPPDSIILLGEGVAPSLVMSDTLVLFGPVRRNDQTSRTFKIWNKGTGTARVLDFNLGGPNSTVFSITPYDRTFSLAPGDSMSYVITFAPTSGPQGSRTGYLDISLDDGKRARRVTLLGYEVEPTMALGRTVMDFGKVKVGATKWDTLSMLNSSNAALTFTQAPIIVPYRSDLPFDYASNWPQTLKPGVKDTLRVRFRPPSRGEFGAWLHTVVNGQRDSVFLRGVGVVPKPVFSPPLLDYGVVATGSSSTLFTTLTDTGDYKIEVCSVEVVGPDKDFFTLQFTNPPLPFTVEVGGKGLNITVRFATTESTGRNYVAWAKLFYCDGTTDSVKLVAREQAQYLEFGNRQVDFGKVRVKTSKALPAAFSNASNTTLSVGKLAVTPPGGPFTVDATSLVVEKRSRKDVQVTFAPMVRGPITGYLHASEGDIKKDSIVLSGIGAAPVPWFKDTVINFPAIEIGRSQSSPLLVRNDGNWLMKTKMRIVNDVNGEFSIDKPEDSLDELQQASYAVTFEPKVPQLFHTADLQFVLDDSSVYIVRLNGMDESNFVDMDSTKIDFGKVRIGTSLDRFTHLVNTSDTDRYAEDIDFDPTLPVFTMNPAPGRIDAAKRSQRRLTVTFRPTAMQPYSTLLVGTGGHVRGSDTVRISGVGAMPIPQFSSALVDFGILVHGTPLTLPVTLRNIGNWDLDIDDITIQGTNAGDFSFDLAKDTTITEGDSRQFNISFVATTPLQTPARTAKLVFRIDDGSTFELDLTAQDKAPIPTDIGFGEYLARPGDKIYAVMKLKTRIPDHIVVRDVEGTVQYDPALVDLLSVERVALTSVDWTLDSVHTPGSFNFSLKSQGLPLREPGGVLRFIFQAKKDLTTKEQTPLRLLMFTYKDTKELVAAMNDGTIIIDGACGPTQLVENANKTGSFIQQNTPNPFGSSLGLDHTIISYDVGYDGAFVSLRLLDAAGRELNKLVDHQEHRKGRYDVRVEAATLGAGVYFYEFRVHGGQPMIRKMLVE